MPSYKYTARERSGTIQAGDLDAVSEDEVISILQHRGLFVTSVSRKDQVKSTKAVAVRASRSRRMHNKVRLDDHVLLCQQLATLVEAGVPLLKSLQVVSAQVESRKLLVALDQVRKDVESGRTFRDSLSKHPDIFSSLWLNLVETGEASGHLSESLQQLASHYEKSQKLQNQVKTAMTYPMFLIGASVLVLFFFMYWIIPRFKTMFDAMNMELPPITLFVLGTSDVVRKYGVVLIIAAVALFMLVVKYLRTEPGKWMRDRALLKIPLMSSIITFSQLAEFTQGLGTLLSSGVPLLTGLEILARSATNKVYGQAVGEIRDAVKEGKPMAEPMSRNDLFPPMAVQMVLVGEEVGELGKMVARVARYYEEQTETFIARVTKLFEPLAIMFMGGLVLVIVLSIFMPIFKMASGANLH